MNQSILALVALLCISLLAFNAHRRKIEQTRWSARSEVEAQAATLGADLLDAAAFAPFQGPPSGTSLGRHLPLAHWNGRRDTIGVPFDGSTLRFGVRATVDAVRKQGDTFVPGPASSPYRQLRLDIAGPLGARAEMVRVYAQPTS